MLFCPATLLPWALMKPPVQLATPGLLIVAPPFKDMLPLAPVREMPPLALRVCPLPEEFPNWPPLQVKRPLTVNEF